MRNQKPENPDSKHTTWEETGLNRINIKFQSNITHKHIKSLDQGGGIMKMDKGQNPASRTWNREQNCTNWGRDSAEGGWGRSKRIRARDKAGAPKTPRGGKEKRTYPMDLGYSKGTKL